jgi:hypothetical protein
MGSGLAYHYSRLVQAENGIPATAEEKEIKV